jgi:glycosyltransferase involved in cell wall biosynthesis
LSGEKGVRTLLAAWERLAVAVPLHIVGDGDLSRRLQSAARSIVVSPVMFRGQLPHQQTVDEIRSARFLVVPSEVMESFGLAAAEAFACGVPVIASDLGAIREIVQDGHNGLHFRCGDAADLSEKVTYAWNRPELTASMGRRARQTFVNSFTAERNYRLLMAIYEGAISDRGQASVPQCAPHLAVGKF